MSEELSKQRILVIEDEQSIRKGLVDLFTYHGFEVEAAEDGKMGLKLALNNQYEMVIIDLMLPELDGFTVCEEIRKVDKEQPIIILTAKTEDQDIINGLSLGADDYITKPFSVHELVLRVQAVLRRSVPALKFADRILQIAAISIDSVDCTGTRANGEIVHFTRREVDILQYLLMHNDRPVPRDELLHEIWGYKRSANIESRTVDIHIAKLRRKIESTPKEPRYLLTVRSEGYRLVPK